MQHNLRLVPYAINKYYPDMGTDERFDDLCQAGANGLITAIDRFEPKRGFRISTYALFWIRHSIVRAMTLSSFTRFPFAMESERQEIGKAREELAFELGRPATDEEVRRKVGISPQRYRDVLRMTRPTYSLHARNRVTQEELINEVTDDDAIGVDAGGRHNTLLRLAIDDLVSLPCLGILLWLWPLVCEQQYMLTYPLKKLHAAGLSETQGEPGDQAAVRAGRQREAHAQRDRRQPQHLAGDGAQVRAQGAHEAQAPHKGGIPAQVHVSLLVQLHGVSSMACIPMYAICIGYIYGVTSNTTN
jgi:hypothetical protein